MEIALQLHCNLEKQAEIANSIFFKNLSYQDGLLKIPHFMSDYTKEIIKFILND